MGQVSTAALQSDEAERTVIGAILLHPVVLADVGDVVQAADFASPVHGAVFRAVRALDALHRPIDPATMTAAMEEAGTFGMLAGHGGAEFFTAIQSHVFAVDSVRYHATQIASKAQRRRCAVALRELAAASTDTGYGDAGFFALMEQRFTQLAEGRREPSGAIKFAEGVSEAVRELAARYEARKAGVDVAITGVRTGFDGVDMMLGGLQPGRFYVIAARPRMGKTSWLLNATRHAAGLGTHCLGFSLEMENRELIIRALSAESAVDGKAIEHVALDGMQWVRLQGAASRLHTLPVWIDATPTLTFEDIRSRARRWRLKHAEGKPAMIWVDYLQLIDGEKGDENRQQEVTRISRGLKGLAKELNCPVVALSQLNRGVEGREDKRPRLSDLRESGAIEQDADVVAFVYRHEVYEAKPEYAGQAEFIVNKNRSGQEGTIELEWDARLTLFRNAKNTNRD